MRSTGPQDIAQAWCEAWSDEGEQRAETFSVTLKEPTSEVQKHKRHHDIVSLTNVLLDRQYIHAFKPNNCPIKI